MTTDMGTTTYQYNEDGLRTSKTFGNGNKVDYYWLDGTLQAEAGPYHRTTYLYDENGSIYGFLYESEELQGYFFYVFNVQGDVIGIINNSGDMVVEYTYDAWGNVTETSGVLEPTLGQINPIRYRGYYYDEETGLYYLNSRYYDAKVGRFISADGEMEGIGGDLRGYNLFAYCFNNPINMSDSRGNWPKWLTGVLNIVSGAGQMAAGTALGIAVGWTGVGAAAAGFLIINGSATATKGIGQIVNDITNSKVMREDNIVRTGVKETGRAIGGNKGAKIAETIYDSSVVITSIYAGTTVLNANMPKVLNSKLFTQNNGYGIKIGKNIEMLYRNPNAAGGVGGTFFSYKGPLGKFRIDWDPTYGFHSHPPGH